MLKFSPKIRLGMLINVMLIKKNMYQIIIKFTEYNFPDSQQYFSENIILFVQKYFSKNFRLSFTKGESSCAHGIANAMISKKYSTK